MTDAAGGPPPEAPKADPMRAFRGDCQVCGEPGLVRPGPGPSSGVLCDRHYWELSRQASRRRFGCLIVMIAIVAALVYGVALLV